MQEELIKEAIDTLKNQKRPELIQCEVYGNYSSKKETFIYSDADKFYRKKSANIDDKTVRSVKAFAEIIKEELRRRNNLTGDKATVSVNLSGGTFIPDDDFGGYTIGFNRLLSQQWSLVKRNLNANMTHKEFLLFLQGLKPSIADFQNIYKSFATLRMVGQTKITSNPLFTEDGQSSGYTCRYELSDGTDGEEKFPSGFSANVQFAKAGDNFYEIPIDLLFYRDEDNELMISVLCPTFENIEEEAIIDEAKYIKAETSAFSELLVLSDF